MTSCLISGVTNDVVTFLAAKRPPKNVGRRVSGMLGLRDQQTWEPELDSEKWSEHRYQNRYRYLFLGPRTRTRTRKIWNLYFEQFPESKRFWTFQRYFRSRQKSRRTKSEPGTSIEKIAVLSPWRPLLDPWNASSWLSGMWGRWKGLLFGPLKC